MAKCKYCGEEISRLDKENCPFCGGRRPLEGVDDSTQDMTKALEDLHDLGVEPKSKSKIVAGILAMFLGVLGIHELYLGKYKVALIIFLVHLVIIGGIGSLMFFTFYRSPFAYLIPYFILEALQIIVGIQILTRPDITDGHGEFLK